MNNKHIIEHIREQFLNPGAQLPFTIISIVLFGSYAQEHHTEHSDIDLLVIAEGINPVFHKRVKEIVTIKNIFSLGIPLDIILMTQNECTDNFCNHNPLFLDIAVSGIVIFDTGCFLQSLIDETLHYINIHNLQKSIDGWKFPVNYRKETFLSSISNKDFAYAMLADGKRDYTIGYKLIDESFYDKAIYHFQQAIEKSIKAILISFGEFKKTHFVAEILESTLHNITVDPDWKEKLFMIVSISKEIEPHVSLSRYPSVIQGDLWIPYEHYTHQDAIDICSKAKIVLDVSNDFVMYWFIE